MSRDEAYLEAEKEIEEALKSDATELDLNGAMGFKLTELPESIGQLRSLQKLNLLGNQLTTLPESLGQLTQLQSLDISSNRLSTLPKILGRLSQLKSLDVANNQLVALPEALGQLTRLQELNLSSNRLTVLPELLLQLPQLESLSLALNQLTTLPEWLGQLTQLQELDIAYNLIELPESIGQLTKLKVLNLACTSLMNVPETISNLIQMEVLDISRNELVTLPKWVRVFSKLEDLNLANNQIVLLPQWMEQLTQLRTLDLLYNEIIDIPHFLLQFENLSIFLDHNPLNPELTIAYKQGFDSVQAYLRAKTEGEQIIPYEAKLILVGEGEVGKTCLMDALLDKDWEEHPSTHGIEIHQFKTTRKGRLLKPTIIFTLNAWDFGGQRVYRPTHQLFFSAPAVYLVVWKPREGSQAGQVKEWIQLVKRREPSAKILVVATHGGPQQRQPDIDRQELWDLFGKETVVDFFFVDSKPNAHGNRKGIDELKRAIAKVAARLPEMGRSVPKSFADVRQALQDKGAPYLPLLEVLDLCRAHNMDDEIARLFITISHRLGHLTHYETDPTLRDIVILRPDWLATAMSYGIFEQENPYPELTLMKGPVYA